ncbi:hypothetical protein [Piscinibacter gummiphilus]|uniref:Uncharacterized protein n=1 Tax=Piscinibacter gummiphilus TaxID=946333 RepID=A0A1W6LGC3_9BURK|nr:hypothetical protein [Piscinibacter gummiphilus]ARN23332.1 hypothetical protein A4W93_27410 [Piscinibacter gummiphilus]GLS97331.1 hypothetical protein GCM10007918_46230 [Piscinibacter gummiphilus]
MKSIAIDFAPGPRHLGRTRALLAFAVVLCASAAWGLREDTGREAAEAERLVALSPAPAVDVPPTRLAAIEAAVSHLDTPWARWFADLEALVPPEVSLLALDVTAGGGEVRLLWRADGVPAMLAFLASVKRHPRLARLEVVHQDLTPGEGLGVQFALEGRLVDEARP